MKRKIIESICFFIIILCVIYAGIRGKEKDNIEMTKEINRDKVERHVEEYMEKIIRSEWENELIKTMAVIIRTNYVYDEMVKEIGSVSNVRNSIEESLVRKNEVNDDMKERIRKGINETKDEIITYHGNIVYPFYHEVSPGITRTEDDILGVRFGYLKEKQCNRDISSKDFFQIKYFNKKDIEDILKKDKGANIYTLVSLLRLNSPNISITTYTENENILRVVCKGKGHGLGLSIYDANHLAKE